jgi:putative transcriptional regulator
MTSDAFTSLKGHFLLAMPSLADPNFRRSVTCISEHTPDGAVGIVVSQVYPNINAKMIFAELGIEFLKTADLISIHRGGPVHADELFILHGRPFDWDGHLMITEDLALGNSRSILEAIAMDRGPEAFLIALGCAGWGPGQLEWEMMQNAWLTLPCAQDIIFHLPVEERWQSAMQRLGIDPDLIVETAGNA